MAKTNFKTKYPRHMTFKGSFKDLKKDGFKFQKLFARNYMQWGFDNGEEYGSDHISVWGHLGGYVEINDYFSLSKAVAKVICTPELLETFSKAFGNSTYYRFILNIHTGEATKYNLHEHDSAFLFANRMHEDGIGEIINKWEDDFRNNYRKVELNSNRWLIHKVRELHEKGWINPFE